MGLIAIFAGALLGSIIGSFIGTLVIRWPTGRSIMAGRSSCDHCGVPLSPVRLVPLVSHALQRGRAACCGGAIDKLHPLAEALCAIVGAAAFGLVADPRAALAGALLGWVLAALALLDARHGWLPDRLNLLLALLGLAAGLAGVQPALGDRCIGGATGFLTFAAIRFAYWRWRGREGMGGGDVKLFGAIGLWLGWRLLPLVLLGAALIGLLTAVAAIAGGGKLARTASVPFGPSLALAGWGCWIAAEAGWLAVL